MPREIAHLAEKHQGMYAAGSVRLMRLYCHQVPTIGLLFLIYTALPYILAMFTFVETKIFSRLVQKNLSDEEYRALQAALITNPKAGPVIPGSGGVRKLRWAVAGRGKRGGCRIIYYPRIAEGMIWMLTLYPKSVRATIPASVLKAIREEIEDG